MKLIPLSKGTAAQAYNAAIKSLGDEFRRLNTVDSSKRVA